MKDDEGSSGHHFFFWEGTRELKRPELSFLLETRPVEIFRVSRVPRVLQIMNIPPPNHPKSHRCPITQSVAFSAESRVSADKSCPQVYRWSSISSEDPGRSRGGGSGVAGGLVLERVGRICLSFQCGSFSVVKVDEHDQR